jgi:negative regulator of flagellin synthesis FlgM
LTNSANRLEILSGYADTITVETGEVQMKIEVNSPTISQLPTDRSPKAVSSSKINEAQSVTEDRTTFRSDSASVQTLTSQALNSPEVRQDKVDALRQSVASGEYKIDPAKIAGAIVDSNSI